MNGVINIYKEKGYTSQDVVARLRGILKTKKIGHTGTLDPDAQGVLPVCIGNATKLFDILTDRTKEYETVLLLGMETDTQDISGSILNTSDNWRYITDDIITNVINSFIGGYEQLPPMYSALKVNGKKLYELAREGKTVERTPRHVDIDNIEIIAILLPRITMRLSVSKGTYIRTICNDIGDKLGCFGCMDSLIRTRAGSFKLEDAIKLDEVERLRDENRLSEVLIPVDELFDYPKIVCKSETDKYLLNGNVFRDCDVYSLKNVGLQNIDDLKYADNCNNVDVGLHNIDYKYYLVYTSQGQFIGIYEYFEKERKYKPFKMFL